MDGILQLLLGLGVMIGGCAYAWGQWKDRRNGSKLDTITLFKEQIKALEGKVNLQDVEIKRLTVEIRELKNVIEIKDKKLGDALAILQGRDPQMAKFVEAGMAYISDTRPVLESLNKYLNKQSF